MIARLGQTARQIVSKESPNMMGERQVDRAKSPRRLRAMVAGVAVAACLVLLPGAAQADFGIVPGSTIGKAHPTVPLLHVSGSNEASQRIADEPGILAAPFVSQAGAHPDATGGGILADLSFQVKDFLVETPPGFVGNPTAVPACDREAFRNTVGQGDADPTQGCPPVSQVGVATNDLSVTTAPFTTPVYRLTPTPGYPASFGFRVSTFGIIINGNVRTDGDYGLTVAATDIASANLAGNLESTTVTLWGVPASPIHNDDRWDTATQKWRAPSGNTRTPFLQTPTDCTNDRLATTATIDSWQEPGRFLPEGPFDPTYRIPAPQPTGCGKLSFKPLIALIPSATDSDSPTGVSVQMEIPLNRDPEGLSTPQLRKAVVTLPEGMSVNPAAADGLQGCSSAQIGLLTTSGAYPNPIRFAKGDADCPQAAKVGAGIVETPLLEERLEGDAYLATPYDNPFHSLLALYLVFRGPGFVIKLPGKIEADPNTGQLTTTFDYSPQLPFENLKLNFFGGPRAPLATPVTCGAKAIETELTPWSAPQSGPPATPSRSYLSDRGPAGAPCSNTAASRPFTPTLLAGTRNPIAGETSAFELRLRRPDGNQEIAGLTVHSPPGFAAYLKGIPYCSEARIKIAEERTGKAESLYPSCPATSQVGTLLSGAGAGPTPLFTPGKAYLAGPYKGAPLSLVTITPALAGGTPSDPLVDLGVVVVRVALHVDPETAQITAVSDPIPQTLDVKNPDGHTDGFPLRIKDVRVILDRPNWVINPTSCDPLSVDTLATGQNGATANLSNRFQVTNCAALGFKPSISLTLKGGTKRAAYPALRAVVRPRPGDANIARAAVTLPHSEFVENAHFRNICTRVEFAAGAGGGTECRKGSIYGHARAWTPLLDRPLEGPVYLRSSNHNLPDLVAALKGPAAQPIEVVLDGRIDSVGGGIRNSFEVVPDAPVSKFVLSMQGGRKGLIVNSTDICRGTHRATARYAAQNGRRYSAHPKVVARGCGKARKARRSARRHRAQRRQR